MTKRKKMSSPASPGDKQVSGGKGLCEEICELKDYIKEELSKLREEFKGWSEARLAAVEEAVSFALDSVAAASAKASAAESEANRAISELETVSQRLRRVEEVTDATEQNARLDLLVFSGKVIPKSRPDENCALLVCKLLEEHMGYRVNDEQISRAHRIQSGKTVVKFNRTGPGSDKEQVWRLRTKLRGKDLYVQESLTERRQEIFQILLQARKDGRIFSAFTQGGKIFYKSSFKDYPHRVSSMDAALALVRAPRAGRDGELQRREQERTREGRRPAATGGRDWLPRRPEHPRRAEPAWTERDQGPMQLPPDDEVLGTPLAGVSGTACDLSTVIQAVRRAAA